MTYYFKIVEHNRPSHLNHEEFHPLINCKDNIEMIKRMVINKYIRDRGGASRMKIFLYYFADNTERFASGKPKWVQETELEIIPTE